MSEQEPGQTNPYGQPDPYGQTNPYGQPTPSGQASPYGQPPAGEPSPYGQPPSYGMAQQPNPDRRPGTVTAAAWVTIVFSVIVGAIFAFTGLALLVARDQVITEIEQVPEFQDSGINADAAVGVLVAVMAGLVVWATVAIVLSVLVLRRSNVARILLVISSVVTALFSLLAITSIVSAVPLIASVAVIVLLFTGGAGAWFKRTTSYPGGYSGGYSGGSTDYPSGQYGDPYGQQPGQGAPPTYPSSDNPYGQQPPTEGGSDHPPQDYPHR